MASTSRDLVRDRGGENPGRLLDLVDGHRERGRQTDRRGIHRVDDETVLETVRGDIAGDDPIGEPDTEQQPGPPLKLQLPSSPVRDMRVRSINSLARL